MLLQYCEDHDLEILENALHIIQINISVTDKVEEVCYESQIPVK